MSSRKVPPRASSRLDLAARIPARPRTYVPASALAPIIAGSDARQPRTALSRVGVTWLSEMLTADKNSFAVVRLLLAFVVLISHSVFLTTGQGALEPLYRWTNYTLGQHGVQVFFFLSGILVTQSLFKSRSVRDYATARALRIFPALIVCVLMTALVLGSWLGTLPAAAYLKDQGVAAYIAKTISLWSGSAHLPGVFKDNPVPGVVNTSVWTLKYEALCYLVLGLVGWGVMKLNRWREAGLAALAVWLAVIFMKPVGLELHGTAKSTLEVFRYFTIFFGAGVLAYALRHYIPVHGSLVLPLGYMFWALIGTRFQEPAAAVFLGYLAVWIATFRFGGLRDFTNQNDYSYATYLYHMPVAQGILHVWPDMHVLPLILATTGIVIWLSFLSWELVERPALALRHRLWQTSPASAEAAFDPALAAADAAPAGSKRATVRVTTQSVSAAAATPQFAPAQSIVPPPRPSEAEVAAARAAEHLARQLVAARAKREVAMSSAPVHRAAAKPGSAAEIAPRAQAAATTPGSFQPGAAQVWRPMPSVKRLKIEDEAPPTEPVAKPAEPAPSPMPLNLLKRAAAAIPAMPSRAPQSLAAASADETPLPAVPASRIAFATKRPAAAGTALIEPAPIAPAPEQSRAVMPVATASDEIEAPRPRASQPRPTWTRPLGQGRGQPTPQPT